MAYDLLQELQKQKQAPMMTPIPPQEDGQMFTPVVTLLGTAPEPTVFDNPQKLKAVVAQRAPQAAVVAMPSKQLMPKETQAELNTRSTPGLDQQQQDLLALRQDIDAFAKKEDGTNPIVASLMAAQDILSGTSNLPKYLQGQKEAQDAKEARALALKAQYQNLAGQYTGKQLELQKQQYQDAVLEKKLAAQEKLQERELALREKALGQKEEKPTTFETTVDKKAAADYQDWNTGSGLPTYEKNLALLEDAKATLMKDSSLSGPVRGLMPDALRRVTNEKAIAVRQQVQQAAQGALKATLGSQFTEKEGERIMNNAYDERLSPEENIKKIDLAIKELQGNAQNRDAMSQYYEQYGTLKGFKPATQRAEAAASGVKEWNGKKFKQVGEKWVEVK